LLQNGAGDKMLDDEREGRINWCLDNGFEYVLVDNVNPTAGECVQF
jgi:hypothetical protein